jgi:hypothetical protein
LGVADRWQAVYGRTTNDKEVKVNAELRYRINRRVFMQYYRQAKSDLTTGRDKSERYMADEIGISHTQLQYLRKGEDSKGSRKNHVNLSTSRRIEHAGGIPRDVAFVPEVVDGRTPARAA